MYLQLLKKVGKTKDFVSLVFVAFLEELQHPNGREISSYFVIKQNESDEHYSTRNTYINTKASIVNKIYCKKTDNYFQRHVSGQVILVCAGAGHFFYNIQMKTKLVLILLLYQNESEKQYCTTNSINTKASVVIKIYLIKKSEAQLNKQTYKGRNVSAKNTTISYAYRQNVFSVSNGVEISEERKE